MQSTFRQNLFFFFKLMKIIIFINLLINPNFIKTDNLFFFRKKTKDKLSPCMLFCYHFCIIVFRYLN